MAVLAPPVTMESPVRAALCGRPGAESQVLFSKKSNTPKQRPETLKKRLLGDALQGRPRLRPYYCRSVRFRLLR